MTKSRRKRQTRIARFLGYIRKNWAECTYLEDLEVYRKLILKWISKCEGRNWNNLAQNGDQRQVF
jgi:hypothetical protein